MHSLNRTSKVNVLVSKYYYKLHAPSMLPTATERVFPFSVHINNAEEITVYERYSNYTSLSMHSFMLNLQK